MEDNKKKSLAPRIPSDIRVYFILVTSAAIMLFALWLIERFIL